MRRLEAHGVITGYTVITDRQAIGRSYEPLVWVTLSTVTRESMEAFEAAAQAIDDVVEVLAMKTIKRTHFAPTVRT